MLITYPYHSGHMSHTGHALHTGHASYGGNASYGGHARNDASCTELYSSLLFHSKEYSKHALQISSML